MNLQVQNATNYLIGPNERAQNVLSLAPILPFRLTSWLVVNNSISVPLVWSPDITNKTDSTFGMGDITLSSPFTVTLKEIFFVALGPTFAFPTATDARLGSYDSGKFSLGPEATIEVTPSHWVLGLSVGNIWSVAGRDSGSTVNAFNLSPSITFNLPWGYYLATSSAIGAAWTVPGDERWAVSWGGGLGAVKLFRNRSASATKCRPSGTSSGRTRRRCGSFASRCRCSSRGCERRRSRRHLNSW